MKEILFRGKRIDNGKWVYGDYVRMYDTYWDAEHCPNKQLYFIIEEKSPINPEKYLIENFIEVIPETVGQFTGLNDKNGKKIFDGDILEIYGEDKKLCQFELVTISHNESHGIFVNYGQFEHNGRSPHWRRVIGNKTDNPELLEDKK